MRLCVIGAGYVGLVSAACFAELGNQVICVERDANRLQQLQNGHCPIHEPGLEHLLQSHQASGQLHFTGVLAEGLRGADIAFIAVGTPQGEDGSADLSHVLAVADAIGQTLRHRCLIVNKSTVPVGSAERIEARIADGLRRRGLDLRVIVASNPEFLKEGSAIDDFTRPDRVILGCEEEEATRLLKALYAPFVRNHERILLMRRREAEFSKYAANAFLATKISFMNEMAALSQQLEVDIEQVRHGIGSDQRIGRHFLYAGCGYGGSCFPKDVRALLHTAQEQGIDLGILAAVESRNRQQKHLLFEALSAHFNGHLAGRVVTLWGLAFKPGTDDLREAPSLVLLEALLAAGCRVQAYDPAANAGVAARYPQALQRGQLLLAESPLAATLGSDALVLVTEWKQFRQPDFTHIRASMRMPVVFDGRNQYDPAQMAELGFLYRGIGRPARGHCKAQAA